MTRTYTEVYGPDRLRAASSALLRLDDAHRLSKCPSVRRTPRSPPLHLAPPRAPRSLPLVQQAAGVSLSLSASILCFSASSGPQESPAKSLLVRTPLGQMTGPAATQAASAPQKQREQPPRVSIEPLHVPWLQHEQFPAVKAATSAPAALVTAKKSAIAKAGQELKVRPAYRCDGMDACCGADSHRHIHSARGRM